MNSTPLGELTALTDEVLQRNPVAIRLNAIRLGLADESTQLSRQALMTALINWKAKTNATDSQTSEMMYELLSVEKAIAHTISKVNVENGGGGQNNYVLPVWGGYAIGFVLILGTLTLLFGAGKAIQKIFS